MRISRNRAVWYWAATLPRLVRLVRHGDPAGAAQEDIGQSLASTRRKSSSAFTRRSLMCLFHSSSHMQQPMKRDQPCSAPGRQAVS